MSVHFIRRPAFSGQRERSHIIVVIGEEKMGRDSDV